MRIDLPFLDKAIQNIGLLLAAALAFFALARAFNYTSDLLSRFLTLLPAVLAENIHRVFLLLCALYVAGLGVWWFVGTNS